MATEPGTFARYLSILGVGAEPPEIEHLSRLVRAQVTRVSFENISKLWLKKTQGAKYIPSLAEHLDGIEHRNFGGTCYANNPFFALLLKYLGYDVRICGADMSKPDVHIVSIVRLDGREYLVDVGYGAPFFDPIPRDLYQPHEITFGTSRYVFHSQDLSGRSKMNMYRGGELIHGYLVKPEPRTIDDFEEVIRDSYSTEATFMNVLVVERFFAGSSVRFHNLTLSESTPEATRITHLADRDELVEAVEHHCEIDVDIVREAIADIPLKADIYS